MLEAGGGHGVAQIRAAVALDVLDQDEDIGLLVEQGGADPTGDRAGPGLVADVEGGDPGHGGIMPEVGVGSPRAQKT